MVESAPGFAANRARISVALSQFTVPMLSRIYAAFDGDMVAALVLGEIAHRNVEAWLSQQNNSEDALYDRNPEHRERILRPCNALSIADACKLPRETVRRKVVHLIARGFVYRNNKGHLYLTLDVGNHFEDMTVQTVEHLLLTAAKLEALLKEQRRLAAVQSGACVSSIRAEMVRTRVIRKPIDGGTAIGQPCQSDSHPFNLRAAGC